MVNRVSRYSIVLLLSLLSTAVSAYTPPYGQPGQGYQYPQATNPYQQPRSGWPYPSQGQPSQYGTPRQPSQYGYPAQQAPTYRTPSTSQQRYAQQPAAKVRMESNISATHAFVYQNLVLTLDIISSENLSSLAFTLPQSDAFIFKSLGERTAKARGKGRKREIVTRQQYLIIPLRQGDYNLDELRAEGSMSSRGRFSLNLPNPIAIAIEPARPGITPWLPLENLTLNARLSNEHNLKEGKPATLELEMTAVGATGAQLPSLEKQLKSAGLRIYREKTSSSGELKQDGMLYGKRIESYTLLPGKEEKLVLPSITIHWWNLITSRAEQTFLPMRVLGHSRQGKDDDEANSGFLAAGNAWAFWLPLLFFAFTMGLYWSLIWAKSRSFGRRYAKHILLVIEPLHRTIVFWMQKLSLRRQAHRIRRFFANSLPRSWRLWYCVRVADNEDDPEFWLQVLRFLVERRLGIPAPASLHRLADYIIEVHPDTDAIRMRNMLLQLDAAIFGNTPLTDFRAWKQQFKAEIRPRLLPTLIRQVPGPKSSGLPALNP